MGIDAWIVVVTVVCAFSGLAFSRIGPEIILLMALMVLVLAGVLTTEQAAAGFSNEGMLTIAVLLIVGAGIRDTGAVAFFVDSVLRRPKTVRSAQVRVMLPVAAVSGFMNNTPLVAMMMPAILDWAKKTRIPASKLMIPLSYAAILGGICTLIGTSTNLLVDGLVREAGMKPLGFFEITPVGLPVAVATLAFLALAGSWLLPDRTPPVRMDGDVREYMLEMVVEDGGPLCGRTIEEAGLRHLQGVYLAEIERGGDVIAAVAPSERLRGNDRLLFAGIVDSVMDLQRIRGLRLATNQAVKIGAPDSRRDLFEVVVSNSSPMLGMSIREGRFRSRYDAAVLAVARNGERIRKKIGDIELNAGDTLLVAAHPEFLDRMRNSRDFFLVSRLDDYSPPRHDRAWIALGILVVMVLVTTFMGIPLLVTGMAAATAMVLTRCCTLESVARNMDARLLLAIAASLGIGKAIEVSGAAAALSQGFLSLGNGKPLLALGLIYVMTAIMTELVTNNAAAALAFPVAVATAHGLGVSERPFIIALMIGASASFITPIGYQTNLMVYGPGGYKFVDFVRAGTPTTIVLFTGTMLLIPYFFPF